MSGSPDADPGAAPDDRDARDAEQAPGEQATRLGLVRRLLVFQFKLLLDGLRDLILSPASVIAVLMGVFGDGRPDGPFRALLRFGRRSDEWIDLFDTHGETSDRDGERPEASANALFDAVERAVREEYEQGGGRSAIEARLRRLRERGGRAEAVASERPPAARPPAERPPAGRPPAGRPPAGPQ